MANILKLLFVIVCCRLVTSVQGNEQTLRQNASTTIPLRLSTSFISHSNSYRTSLPSEMISATTAPANSSLTPSPTIMSTPTMVNVKEDGSALKIVVGCAASLVLTLLISICITVLYWWRKGKEIRQAREQHRKENKSSRIQVENEVAHEVVVSVSAKMCLRTSLPPRALPSPALPFGPDESLSGPPTPTSQHADKSKFAAVAAYYNSVAEPGVEFEAVSTRPDLKRKQIITVNGGVISIDDITLNIGPGCLIEDTEVTLIKDDRTFGFKSLLDLGLVDTIPPVFEFLPDGLKFSKPALLTIKFKKTVSDSELLILHGSKNRDRQTIVWKSVTNDIEKRTAEEVVLKVSGFSFYTFIMARNGMLSRFLSHFNHSFTCCSYVFYRRRPAMTTIDISVVLVSNFVDGENEGQFKQRSDHEKEGYIKGDKGMAKCVDTTCHLEVTLDFPGFECRPFSFKVDEQELDKSGFVVDKFKGSAIGSPANGIVRISEVDGNGQKNQLWELNFCEGEEARPKVVEELIVAQRDSELEGVQGDRLSNEEISRMGRVLGVDWDNLAALLDLPYTLREQIRREHTTYPDTFSKAEKILLDFNYSSYFCRYILEKSCEELDLGRVIKEMSDKSNGNKDGEIDEPPVSPDEKAVLTNETPLSSREMYRLGRQIGVDWDSLAGLMNIERADRENVRTNATLNDASAKAEKILSIFNRKRDFSRDKLVECLKGIKKMDLIEPVTTGAWRKLIVRNLQPR